MARPADRLRPFSLEEVPSMAAGAVVGELAGRAAAKGCSPGQLALAWVIHQPGVTSAVIGPLTVEQLEDGLAAVELALSEEDLVRLDEVSRLPLIYPYWHQHNFARPRFSEADRALHASYPDRHYGGEDPLV